MGIRASSGGQLGGGNTGGNTGVISVENIQDIVSESVTTATEIEGLRLTSVYDDALGKLRLNLSTFGTPITNVIPASVLIKKEGVAIGAAKEFDFSGSSVQSIDLENDIATINLRGGGGSGGTLEVSQDGGTSHPAAFLNFIGATVNVVDDEATISIDTALAKSAYQLALDNGFVGSLAQWLASLIGAQGATGPAGRDGTDGSRGEQGIQGLEGDKGEQGVSVRLLGSVQTLANLPTVGAAGEGWIVQSNGNLYIWNTVTFTWNDVGQIVGPQGNDGAQGPAGAQGDAGPAGPQGAQGIAGPAGSGAGFEGVDLYQNNILQGGVLGLNFAGAAISIVDGVGTVSITGGGAVDSVNGQVGTVILGSDDVTEGTSNLYFTNSRFDSRFNVKTTDDLEEGSRLYFTNSRFDTRFAQKSTSDLVEGTNKYFTNTAFDARLAQKTADSIAEGTVNKYFTDIRARGALSASSIGPGSISYSASNGVISYVGPTNTEIRSAFTAGTGIVISNGQVSANAIPNSALTNSSVTVAGKVVSLGGSTTITVGDLSGVDIVSNAPSAGQALVWDGSKWVPGSPTAAGTVASVNGQSGTVVLTSSNIAEGSNQYFTTARARGAISATGWSNLSYNASTGVINITAPTTDNVTEGANKYYTDARVNAAFDTRLATKSTTNLAEGTNLYYTDARVAAKFSTTNLADLANVTSDTPSTGQVLKWNGTAWQPMIDAAGAGIHGASIMIDYNASGDLIGTTVVTGNVIATITNAVANTCEVTFQFPSAKQPPLTTVVYGYQRTPNIYVQRAVDSNFNARRIAGGGTEPGFPTAFSTATFNSAVNTMVLSVTRTLTGATSPPGQPTHCIVQFTLV